VETESKPIRLIEVTKILISEWRRLKAGDSRDAGEVSPAS